MNIITLKHLRYVNVKYVTKLNDPVAVLIQVLMNKPSVNFFKQQATNKSC